MRTLTLSALLFCALAPLPARADDEAVRTQFREALADARAGRAPAAEDGAVLRDYILYPYLQATRVQGLISRGPDGAADAPAERFLAAYPELPVSRELRRQWLLDLARRQQWSAFLAHDAAGTDDPALVCARWQARIATTDAAAVREPLLAFWVDAPQMPSGCTAPFDWLQAQGAITAEALERRARKALADGNTNLAASLIARLPPERTPPLAQWRRLLDDPPRALAAIVADPQQRFEWPALKAGFDKLARRDPQAAQAVLRQLDRSRLDTAQYGELARAAALGLAWDRRPEAPAAFQSLPEDAVDESVREWRIRAALWNGQWPIAAAWLQALPAGAADDPRWVYWRARVAEKLGRKAEARPLYEQLAGDNGYYSVLAAWRLGERYAPRRRRLEADAAQQQQLLTLPALRRARELFYADEIRWADSEWRSATQGLPESQRVQAALLAAQWGWHWQAVLLLTQMNATDALDLLYPQKIYTAEIHEAARRSALPPAWIYGVMRQESLFLPQAVSSSDALGLLQLKLSTARDTARRIGLRKPDREDLFDPETNLALGSAYLRQMTDRYGGQFVLTVASYNAGPNAVARWLPEAPLDADVWIENVPYNETRKYVQRIAWHIAVHDWQTTGRIRDFDELLQPVRRAAP